MAMKGSGGGGYGSRPHVEKPVRTGSGSHGTHPGGVAQLGQHVGDKAQRTAIQRARATEASPCITIARFNQSSSGMNLQPMSAAADRVQGAHCTANQVSRAVTGNGPAATRVRRVAEF